MEEPNNTLAPSLAPLPMVSSKALDQAQQTACQLLASSVVGCAGEGFFASLLSRSRYILITRTKVTLKYLALLPTLQFGPVQLRIYRDIECISCSLHPLGNTNDNEALEALAKSLQSNVKLYCNVGGES